MACLAVPQVRQSVAFLTHLRFVNDLNTLLLDLSADTQLTPAQVKNTFSRKLPSEQSNTHTNIVNDNQPQKLCKHNNINPLTFQQENLSLISTNSPSTHPLFSRTTDLDIKILINMCTANFRSLFVISL